MKTILELIRWKNILFLACSLILMQYAVVNPTLAIYGFEPQLGSLQILLMIAGISLIAAGGYAINDYFDVKIDEINKPMRRIVGRLMDRRQAMIYHQIFTITGAICGIILAIWLKSFTLGIIYAFIPGLLWFYSASYKRQFFIGNLIVAFHIALSFLIIAIANVIPLTNQYGTLLHETPILKQIYGWISGFAIFAFLCTLLREIIKDIEDEKGDREFECHTLPIKLGITKTKWILYALIAIICGLLCYVNYSLLYFPIKGSLSTRYMIFGLLLPFAALAYLIIIAKRKNDYHNASTMCKFIMALGVLYSIIYYYLLAQQYGISLFGLFVVK